MTQRTDWDDRIADVFLAEALGRKPPPDLSGRIRRKVASRRRARRTRRALVAAAAGLALAGALWLARPDRRPPPSVETEPAAATYPKPAAAGSYAVAGEGPVCRGAALTTDEGEAHLSLGGYVRVAMRPQTAVVLAGSDNAEELELEYGEIECDVEEGKDRTFSVRTELGAVSVAGTRFTVQLEQEEDGMNIKSMVVKVMVGAVVVTALGADPAVVHAGERRAWQRDRGGRDRVGIETVEDADTPLEKARVACRLLERALESQREQIENETLQDADVAAALKAWQDATRVYTEALNNHPEYQDLKADRKAAREELRKLMREMRGRGRDEWRKRRDEFTKLRNRSTELRGKMTKLADRVPKFVELKKKKQDTLEQFLTQYQEKLKANEKYQELGERLEELEAWEGEIEDRRREERRRRRRERAEEE